MPMFGNIVALMKPPAPVMKEDFPPPINSIFSSINITELAQKGREEKLKQDKDDQDKKVSLMRSVEAKAQGVLDAMQIEDESRENEEAKKPDQDNEVVVPEKKDEAAKLVKGLFPQNILSSTIIKKDDKDDQQTPLSAA